MRRSRVILSGLLSLLVICFNSGLVAAHDLHISKVYLIADGSKLHLELSINAHELRFMEEVDRNNNGRIGRVEFESSRKAISGKLLKALQIEMNGEPLKASSFGVMMDLGSHHLLFRSHYPGYDPVGSLKLRSHLQAITSRSHVSRVIYRLPGKEKLAKLWSRANSVTFDPERVHRFFGFAVIPFGATGILAVVLFGLTVVSGIFYSFCKICPERNFFNLRDQL